VTIGRDEGRPCSQIQAKVKYKDSGSQTNWQAEGVETDSYARTVVGVGTDWVEAYGRSPNLSATWWGYSR